MDAITSQAGVAVAGSGEYADALLEELYATARAEACGLGLAEFSAVLRAVGEKYNFGVNQTAGFAEKAAFWRGLKLEDLALAHGCALGLDKSWQRFVTSYREPLTRAAVAIAGSATEGHELAGSLYGDLFGLREREGVRRSPLSGYSGRGSLMGWLRTTLAQRHIDRHRRTHRETPLEDQAGEIPAKESEAANPYASRLAAATATTLAALHAEDRYLLASYFLDGRTLLQIARLQRVHEATISRRIRRLAEDLRKQLMRKLQEGGLSRRAAEEALRTDPRDVAIDLSKLFRG